MAASRLIAAALIGLTISAAHAEKLGSMTLVGKVPGRYLKGKAKTQSYLSKVVITDGVIREVTPITEKDVAALKGAVVLSPSKGKYDVIYPGLFNLHNHTKQNVMPVWGDAKGQFGNRFEWRGWGKYTEAVSGNMNPWVKDYGKVISCAAFRWSEMQAMVLGTTFLQGPSTCVSDFAISHVEGGDSIMYEKTDAKGGPVVPMMNVLAPTDILDFNTFSFLWNEVKPKMTGGKSFAKALETVFFKYCPDLKEKVMEAYQASLEDKKAKLVKTKEAFEAKANSATKAAYLDAKNAVDTSEVMLDAGALKIAADKKLIEKSCKDYDAS